MSEGVPIRYVWTLAELAEATRWHLRRERMRGFFVFLWLLAMLAAVFATVIAWRAGKWPQTVYVLAAAIYLLLLPKLRPWLVQWQMRRSFAKSSSRDAEVSWRIEADSLRFSAPNSSSEMKWAAFNQAMLTPAGLLLYPQPGFFYWLPRKGFETEEGFETVAAWARQRIAAFRELR